MNNSAVFVIGPAGAGKSTFCSSIVQHGISIGRTIHLFNLDPAAEYFQNPPSKDIKDLITVEEVMEEFSLGPNGGLVYCMDFLLENIDWLETDLNIYSNEYLIIDCPGQIELYTHFDYFKKVISIFQKNNYSVCCIYLMESIFLQDISKYFAGVLNAMSAMIQLEVPHINVISKMDLLKSVDDKFDPSTNFMKQEKEIDEYNDSDNESNSDNEEDDKIGRFLNVDTSLLRHLAQKSSRPRFFRLNEAVVQLIEEYNMVSFIPCNIYDEDSLSEVLFQIDHAIQYGESVEPKEPKEHYIDEEEE